MKPNLPIILSLNAGYVDASRFLALQGLFAAHVTGNFVTLCSGDRARKFWHCAKLLALPVFGLFIPQECSISAWIAYQIPSPSTDFRAGSIPLYLLR